MGRAVSIAVFAVAVAAAALASSGVAVPAHRMPVGTPLAHAMPFSAYRLGFLIEPTDGREPLTPAMAVLHRALRQAGGPTAMEMSSETAPRADEGPFFETSALAPVHDLGLALALLVVLLPRLARPTQRLIVIVLPPAIVPSQWGPAVPLDPPRGIALPAARA